MPKRPSECATVSTTLRESRSISVQLTAMTAFFPASSEELKSVSIMQYMYSRISWNCDVGISK